MESVIVERSFDKPMTEREDPSTVEAIMMCMDLHNVLFVESFVSNERRRAICHFKAPDVESVRQVLAGAGLTADAVWRCER